VTHKFLGLDSPVSNNRMSKIMLNFRPNWRRRLGRPLKRLLDEAEIGISSLNSWRIMTLSVFLYSILMMVAKVTETCRWLIIYFKAYFTGVFGSLCKCKYYYEYKERVWNICQRNIAGNFVRQLTVLMSSPCAINCLFHCCSVLVILFLTLCYSFHVSGSSPLLQNPLTGGKESSSLSTFSGL
jgi:hypothetical protein